jgi:hypothetical protein
MAAETNTLIAATQTVLRDIAKQASALATGLQNAAPPQGSGSSNSVSYLTETAAQLHELCRAMDDLSSWAASDK